MSLHIDTSRLEHLRRVSGRENRAVSDAVDAQSAATTQAERLRKEILALQRRDDGTNTATINIKRNELAKVKKTLETAEQTLEIHRERAASARKLHDRANTYIQGLSA